MAAVQTARSLATEQLPAAAEKLYVLLLQVPAANRLITNVRESPSGAALANLLLASGPSLYQDAAFVISLLLASSHLFPRIQPCTPVAGSPLHLFFLMSLLIIALPVLHCGRATFLNYISHWESTSL